MLQEECALTRYALAFLRTEREEARFFWRTGGDEWVRVRMERRRAVDGDGCVVALMHDADLRAHRSRARRPQLLTGGLPNREIALRLQTGTRTVSTHVEHILLKLGARSRAGAAAMAADRGLFRLPLPDGGEGMERLAVGELEALVRAGDREPTKRVPVSGARRRPCLIGSALPLSGPARADGLEMRNGAALAIDEINARVAWRGADRTMLVDTDIFTEGGVRTAFEHLVDTEVDAITIGYALAGADLILELAADYGAPYRTQRLPSSSRSVRSDPGRFRRIFQVCPSGGASRRGFVRFLDSLVTSGHWSPADRSLVIIETAADSGQMATSPDPPRRGGVGLAGRGGRVRTWS